MPENNNVRSTLRYKILTSDHSIKDARSALGELVEAGASEDDKVTISTLGTRLSLVVETIVKKDG